MTPEYSHIVRLDTLGPGSRRIELSADEAERAALARRFGVIAIGRLAAEVELRREGDAVIVDGMLDADVIQSCVATGDPLAATIATPFRLRFVPEDASAAEEIELSEADCDTIGYEGGQIDLGEAVAQTLALEVDPFPRGPAAETALRDAGVLGEEEAGPFGALKGLRDRMRG